MGARTPAPLFRPNLSLRETPDITIFAPACPAAYYHICLCMHCRVKQSFLWVSAICTKLPARITPALHVIMTSFGHLLIFLVVKTQAKGNRGAGGSAAKKASKGGNPVGNPLTKLSTGVPQVSTPAPKKAVKAANKTANKASKTANKAASKVRRATSSPAASTS